MLEIKLPQSVYKLLDLFASEGFEAFVVGGCIRDSLLKQYKKAYKLLSPKDWDITTNAEPSEITEILKRAKILNFPTGIQYGTITAILQGKNYEITTYRSESEYILHRKPRNVEFVPTLNQDLSRRDFSINAMAYHPKHGLIDIHNGLKHLKSNLICAVGDPTQRFEEDALRILRALRFASRFDFDICPKTKMAIFSKRNLLKFISKERVLYELKGIVQGRAVTRVLAEFGEIINTSMDESLGYIDEMKLQAIACSSNDFTQRMAILLLNKTFEEVDCICRNLKFKNLDKKLILLFLKYAFFEIYDEKVWVKKWLHILGEDSIRFESIVSFKQAIAKATKSYQEVEKLQRILELAKQILQAKEAFSLKTLCLNGNDLKKNGIEDGKKIKTILELALKAVIEEKISNTPQELIKFLKENSHL